jgi:single-strand DNA-binding protein
MNEIQVTLRGNVASEPRLVRFDDGNVLTSFRLASTARRFDRDRREWVDRGTTFVNVTCRKAMATNAATSVRKGQPMVVTGKLSERFWSANGRSGQTLELQAEGLGHDLTYGTAQFARIVRAERPPLTDVSGLTVLDEDDDGQHLDETLDRHGADLGGADLGGAELGGTALDGAELDGTELMDDGDLADRRLNLTSAG